ncbi:MAG: FAD-dependent oxidoreductase [Paracoccaceae bacterium]|nr:FAD-dependent oxidoreductase [Paracoccaceae bacterium]
MNELPSTARTVIIGGGISGCSTAYHLAKAGRTEIVVLERSKLTSGTTWHAAGLVRRLRPSGTLTNLINYSIDLYGQLEEETGQSCGWLQCGSLSISTNRDRTTTLKRQVSLGRAFGLEAELVDGKRAQELWPIANMSDVEAAIHSPADGRVNPSDTALALSKGARARGVQFFEDTPVTGFEKAGGRIAAVLTAKGRIACDEVVIACGLWSRDMARLAGAHMPLYACEHLYLLTKPIDGIDGHYPNLGAQDDFLYIRDDVGGLLVGSFEPHAKPLPVENLPANFSFDLLDEDWDHFAPMMENALHRIPALETAEVRMLLNGPESFTLDNQFMVGESPDVPGLFLMGGMNSTGIALAGGVGRALAEWMIEGTPTMDLIEADVRRFAPGVDVLSALHERIPEILGKHYEITYPGVHPQTVRDQFRTPCHAAFSVAGAQFAPRGGWERPEFFAPGGLRDDWQLTFGVPPWRDLVGEEYRAAKEGALLFDQSPYGKFWIEGPDAETFLNRLCANDMSIEPGRIVYSQVLNTRGGIESDVTVQRHGEDRYLMITGQGEALRMKQYLERQQGDRHVVIVDQTSASAILGLAGPRAEEILQAASHAILPKIGRFRMAEVEIGYAGAMAGRLSYTGEPGFELYIPAEAALTAHAALVAAGESRGLRHGGSHAVGSLRLEAGHRSWGHDLTPGITPLQAGFDRFVAWDKPGGFVGREALLAEREAGPARRIVSLVFDGPDAIPIHDEPVFVGGDAVGQVTSAAWGYGFGRTVALALVSLPGDVPKPGLAVEVEIACERFGARASLTPPKQAAKEIAA